MTFAANGEGGPVGASYSSQNGRPEDQQRGEANEASHLRALVAAQNGEEQGGKEIDASKEVVTLQDLKGLLSELLLHSSCLLYTSPSPRDRG